MRRAGRLGGSTTSCAELGLPLSDASIIREQAAEKHLDPALIAAVIYAETKFDPRPSSAGAQGLMQILPATAYYLAHLSGGSRFTASDLATPSVNVAYGSYYLRYLLDHYDGNEMLAVAAYNGGPGQRRQLGGPGDAAGRQLTVEEIPFPRDARIRAAGARAPSARTARLRPRARAASRRSRGARYGRRAMPDFKLDSVFTPTADQPKAIAALAEGVEAGERFQTLLGATGTGKTMTMAGVIEAVQRPTLVIAHNKTLAAQLCNEFRTFFPDNAVEYFVSYYDYYQPEAYVPSRDLYIEKDSAINQEVDRLRHAATAAVFARRDVIVVASVSCIYGLGSPETYEMNMQILKRGEEHRPRRAAAQAGLDPVHAQRHRALARHLPRAGRDARGVPRLRRDGLPGERCSATRSSACSTSTRSPAS